MKRVLLSSRFGPLARARASLCGQALAFVRAARKRRHGSSALVRAFRSSLGSSPEIALLITSQRTGSTLFCSLFQQLPGCGSIYEALNPGWTPFARGVTAPVEVHHYLRRASSGEDKPLVLTKAFFQDLTRQASVGELSTLMPDSLFVVLWRRDLLAAFVSLKLAELTGRWHQRSATRTAKPAVSITIDIDEFRHYRQGIEHDYRRAADALTDHRRLLLVRYEDLAGDKLKTMASVAAAANALFDHSDHLAEWFVKPDRDPASIVSNWSELTAALHQDERYLSESIFHGLWPVVSPGDDDVFCR